MAITLTDTFKEHLSLKNTSLIPVVNIDNTIYLSIKPIDRVGNNDMQILPLLLNVPRLSEKLDLNKKKYKINNLQLSISNKFYKGERFSDRVGENALINKNCTLYFRIDGTESEIVIYKGVIRNYSHTSETVYLSIEDQSQDFSHIDIPNKTEDFLPLNIRGRDKGEPKPIVYGRVDKSPCPFDGTNFWLDKNPDAITGLSQSWVDDVPYTSMRAEWDVFIADDDRLARILNSVELNLQSIEQVVEDNEVTDPIAFQESKQMNLDEPSGANIVDIGSNKIELVKGPLFSLDVLQCLEIWRPEINFIKIKNHTEEEPENYFPGYGNYFNLQNHLQNNYNSSYWDDYSSDFKYFNNYTGENAKYGWRRWIWRWKTLPTLEHYGKKILYISLNGALLPAKNAGESNFQGGHGPHKVYVVMRPHINGEVQGWRRGDGSIEHFNIDEVGLGGPTSAHQLFSDPWWNEGPEGFNQLTGEIEITSSMTATTALSHNTNPSADELLYFFDYAGIGHDDETKINDRYEIVFNYHYMGKLGAEPSETYYINTEYNIKGTVDDSKIAAIVDVKDVSKKNFYAYLYGRGTDQYSKQPTIVDIFKDFLSEFFDIDLATNISENNPFNSIYYAFTLNEIINSKTFLEEIASSSCFAPRFNIQNEFILSKIPMANPTLTDSPNSIIAKQDIISYSFKRTPIQDVITKINMKYKWDYVNDKYESETGDILVNDLVVGYNYDYYGITEDNQAHHLYLEDNTGKYIRDEASANKIASYILTANCNQKLILKLKLPLKYFDLEVGDIVRPNGLIGNIKPYGIDYTKEVLSINSQIAYNKFIVISTNKTIKHVEIEIQQVHLAQAITCEEGYDCLGVCGGDTILDACGVCGGETQDAIECTECEDNWCNGSAPSLGLATIMDQNTCESLGECFYYTEIPVWDSDIGDYIPGSSQIVSAGITTATECWNVVNIGPSASNIGTATVGDDWLYPSAWFANDQQTYIPFNWVTEAVPDCNGDCGGTASIDDCGNCGGDCFESNGWTGNDCLECGCEEMPDTDCDCNGNKEDCSYECGGTKIIDECGECVEPHNTCSVDCSGEDNGDASIEPCNYCTGDPAVGHCFTSIFIENKTITQVDWDCRFEIHAVVLHFKYNHRYNSEDVFKRYDILPSNVPNENLPYHSYWYDDGCCDDYSLQWDHGHHQMVIPPLPPTNRNVYVTYYSAISIQTPDGSIIGGWSDKNITENQYSSFLAITNFNKHPLTWEHGDCIEHAAENNTTPINCNDNGLPWIFHNDAQGSTGGFIGNLRGYDPNEGPPQINESASYFVLKMHPSHPDYNSENPYYTLPMTVETRTVDSGPQWGGEYAQGEYHETYLGIDHWPINPDGTDRIVYPGDSTGAMSSSVPYSSQNSFMPKDKCHRRLCEGSSGFGVLSLVQVASAVMEGQSDAYYYDCNQDGDINVLDVVYLANCILNQNCDSVVVWDYDN